MELRELIEAVMSFDALRARQWVADAMRLPVDFSSLPRPNGLDPQQLAVAAGIVETLAQRLRQEPPEWAREIPASAVPLYLVRSAQTMPRLRRLCEQEGPEPLRRRNILAPPEFLTVA